jgi:hypothetical protein
MPLKIVPPCRDQPRPGRRSTPSDAACADDPVPVPRPARRSATTTARRYSTTTSLPPVLLLITLPPFPMHVALPRSKYYGGSATTRCPQRASRLPTDRQGAGRIGRHRIASHVHWRPLRRVSAPSYTPVASPRAAHHSLGPGLPPPKSHRRRKRTAQEPRTVQHHEATHPPDSAGRRRLTRLQPLVQFPYAFLVLASGHESSGSTDPPLRCRGCSRPSPQPGVRPASSFDRSL